MDLYRGEQPMLSEGICRFLGLDKIRKLIPHIVFAEGI